MVMLEMILFIFIQIIIFGYIQGSMIRAPSVFRSDEVNFHKYSAVLAVTEPFRQQCQEQIKKSLSSFQYYSSILQGKSLIEKGKLLRKENIAIDAAIRRFEMRIQNTLRSYGMTSGDFNSLSNVLNKQPNVRKKVLLQAYFYKIGADLEQNLKKGLPFLPNPSQSNDQVVKVAPFAPPIVNSTSSFSVNSKSDDTPQIVKFAKILRSIENERLSIREKIKNDLHLKELPPRMSDPQFLPAMNPIIQKACKTFPFIAGNIILKNNLPIEEFNSLQEKVKSSFLYRWQVNQEISKLDKQSVDI